MPEISAPVVVSTDPDVVERLAREVADLRAEVEHLRADRPSPNGHRASPGGDERSTVSKRRLGRRRRPVRRVSPAEGEAMSRRRLLGLAGTAAAAGVGGALLAGSTAEAAVQNVILDGTAATNSGTATTFLTTAGTGGTYDNSTLHVQTTATDKGAIIGMGNGAGTGIVGSSNTGAGIAGNSGAGTGVSGQASTGNAAQFVAPLDGSAGAHLLLAPSATAGAPTGAHNLGQFWVDSTGKLFYCVMAGSPGTWVSLSSPLVTLPPTRVYDSRVGQLPPTGPKSRIANGMTVNVDVTLGSAIPLGASAVLGNITVVSPSAGVFLTVFAEGASAPATSNINASAGQVVANNFTSKIGTSNGISIQCGGGPTDFIIDIFGYYP